MNNTTKFLTQIRPLINAKGVERAGGMPANSLGDFYSKLDAGKNPGLSEAALLGLIKAVSPVIIAGARLEYNNGIILWAKYIREDRECLPTFSFAAEHYTVEHRGALGASEISDFINGLEWPE